MNERITLPILDDITMRAAATQLISEARAAFRSMEQLSDDSATQESILEAWDRINIDLENILGPVSILGSVHPDRKVRDAADDVLIEATKFGTELFQNVRLFELVSRTEPKTAAAKQLKKDLLEGFEDSGVALPADKRARVREIFEEIERLNQDFDRNIRDNTSTITFSEGECAGLPAAYLGRAKRDEAGNIVLSYDYPDYVPFMANAHDATARHRYYLGYMTRGTEANTGLLDQIVKLRRELATLYELPSYAHYVTRRQMVEEPARVETFLNDVANVVREAEERDLDELRKLKAEMNGTPFESTKIERWDQSYYSEKLRQKKFAVDQEALRRYFPTPQTVEWVLRVTGLLYGVKFERATVPVWHEEVAYYDLFEEDGTFIGGVYLDLFPRDGKYKHAAAWGVRGVSRKAGRTPVSVLVCNFDRTGLTHNELETLFHEFGHALHGVLSCTEYNQHSGTSVERDFVEAPSQMYEEWARKYESLATLSEVSPDSPAVEPELVERLAAARRFGRGINYARQWLYASFDMALASALPRPAMELWQEMEGSTPMGYVPGTEFPGTFSHIAGDYAAGYYGYMWSEVLALDMLSAFGDDIMNKEVGRRFRETILSRGGEQPAREMVRNFLGRDVSSEAFFREITGKR